MKIHTILMSAAIVAAAATAQTFELHADVSVPFSIGAKSQQPGEYIVSSMAPGTVIVRSAARKPLAFISLPVQVKTADMARESFLLFESAATGNYKLLNICIAGKGCWASHTFDTKKPQAGTVLASLRRR